jgi:hypothetical protein
MLHLPVQPESHCLPALLLRTSHWIYVAIYTARGVEEGIMGGNEEDRKSPENTSSSQRDREHEPFVSIMLNMKMSDR